MYSKSLGLAALVCLVASCSDGPTHPLGCSGDIQVSVDTRLYGSTRPVFSWTPRCGVTDLSVVTMPIGIGDPALVWSVSVPDSLRMAPPIVYGNVPPGAFGYTTPQTLVAGQRYRVSIGMVVGGDAIAALGEATFTP